MIDTFEKIQGFDHTPPESMGLFINRLSERNPEYIEVAKTNRNLVKDIFEVSVDLIVVLVEQV